MGKDLGERPLPQRHTDTRPGSAERIAVYRRRYARGESIFHPADHSLSDSERWFSSSPQTGIRIIKMADVAKSAS